MTQIQDRQATFNLWTEPWIHLELPGGGMETHGIQSALLEAQRFRFIYDPSPLVVVGIHRLLVAILQAALSPKSTANLLDIRDAGRFSAQKIAAFREQYEQRFDLFSEETPFLQSADISLQPPKETKTVAYLAPEMPSGTGVIHYRHHLENDQAFCPACAARGLVCVPPFATSGGAGIRPSINGVPPLYVIPGGETLFDSLTASLIRPQWFPPGSCDADRPWWGREALVARSGEVTSVGYLQSLTFPARRVRLFPEQLSGPCTHCGETLTWGVRRMVFEMGESRPKDAEIWFDPFAAYRLSDGKDKPVPVRPTAGRAVWREYAGLFLRGASTSRGKEHSVTIRPRVLDQIDELSSEIDTQTYAFRCIGMRTDMKAKVFEWVDTGFEVPPTMLRDDNAGDYVQRAVGFATDCAGIISGTFREHFGGKAKKSERNRSIKSLMVDRYWAMLADTFRAFIREAAKDSGWDPAEEHWADGVVQAARQVFAETIETLGDDAETLRKRAQAEKWCLIRLAKKRKEGI